MSFRKSIERVASIYLENKGFFPPELIGAESDGALLYESDEEYMKPNFSAQIFRELSDRQVAGELSDGQPITEQREPQGGRKGERIAQRIANIHLKKKPRHIEAGRKILCEIHAEKWAEKLGFPFQLGYECDTWDTKCIAYVTIKPFPKISSHLYPVLATKENLRVIEKIKSKVKSIERSVPKVKVHHVRSPSTVERLNRKTRTMEDFIVANQIVIVLHVLCEN